MLKKLAMINSTILIIEQNCKTFECFSILLLSLSLSLSPRLLLFLRLSSSLILTLYPTLSLSLEYANDLATLLAVNLARSLSLSLSLSRWFVVVFFFGLLCAFFFSGLILMGCNELLVVV